MKTGLDVVVVETKVEGGPGQAASLGAATDAIGVVLGMTSWPFKKNAQVVTPVQD